MKFSHKKLKEKRKENRYSQADCAKVLNIVPSAYNRKEGGKAPIEEWGLAKIANLFKCSVEDFYDLEDGEVLKNSKYDNQNIVKKSFDMQNPLDNFFLITIFMKIILDKDIYRDMVISRYQPTNKPDPADPGNLNAQGNSRRAGGERWKGLKQS